MLGTTNELGATNELGEQLLSHVSDADRLACGGKEKKRKHGVLMEAEDALSDHGVCVRKRYVSSDNDRWTSSTSPTPRAARSTSRQAARTPRVRSLRRRLGHQRVAEGVRPAGQGEEALRARARRGDRPGLLSEVFALHHLRCGTIDARMWTHGGRVAALVCVREEDTGASIHEPVRIRRMESRLRHVLRGGARGARTILVDAATVGNLDRRFHQLLNGDGEADNAA
ncbi:ACT domain-containing protein ACR5-like [Lolium perenne]|uniref:ACT domain-containing protein ACR5-like n=1 Tax=Lolium perenne TaxID=4522 RepID=UPI0021F65AEA|nr:ACT domain-containing protein ACR5-like [Lolium perenne]